MLYGDWLIQTMRVDDFEPCFGELLSWFKSNIKCLNSAVLPISTREKVFQSISHLTLPPEWMDPLVRYSFRADMSDQAGETVDQFLKIPSLADCLTDLESKACENAPNSIMERQLNALAWISHSFLDEVSADPALFERISSLIGQDYLTSTEMLYRWGHLFTPEQEAKSIQTRFEDEDLNLDDLRVLVKKFAKSGEKLEVLTPLAKTTKKLAETLVRSNLEQIEADQLFTGTWFKVLFVRV